MGETLLILCTAPLVVALALVEMLVTGAAGVRGSLKTRTARLLINVWGGAAATGTITGYFNNYDDHTLTYAFSAGEPPATVTGEIATGWDIMHIALSGGALPAWKDRYRVGYQFPVRYWRPNPRFHVWVHPFVFE